MTRKGVLSVFASIAIVAALASCGSLISFESGAPSDDGSGASAEERSQPTAEGSGDADGEEGSQPTEEPSEDASDQSSDDSGEEGSQATEEGSGDGGGIVGDLIMIEDDGYTYTLTFVDTLTGDSDSRYFTLPDEGEINPAGNRGLPFDEDFTKLAVVSEWRDGEYYRSAGYVAAGGGYTEETSARSSFEGESGFYAATFHEGRLWVMNRNYEWLDAASGDVRGESPKIGGNASEFTDMYISGSRDPTEYGLGECWNWGTLPSQVTSKCYESVYDGDIEFFSNEMMIVDGSNETIEVNGACDSLLALDSEDNFYCVEELDNGQRLVRIENSGGEAREITPETDQEILQAVVSTNGEQVLFTAQRDDDPITAYVVPPGGGAEPRELPALSGYLSNEDQWLYRWTPN